MVWWSLYFAGFFSAVALCLVGVDLFIRAREDWRERKKVQGGVYGIVVDRRGAVLGTYINPMQPTRRASYAHRPGSAWTDPDDPTSWAWEGQGGTAEEARHVANRLRHKHMALIPELNPMLDDDESGGLPWA
jgi:hypothetical protein